MIRLRLEADRRAGRVSRSARPVLGGGIGAALAFAPLALVAAPVPAAAYARPLQGHSIQDFYAARGWQPLWFAPGNEQAGSELLHLLRSARGDGLDPRRYRIRDVERALRSAWGGNEAARRRAELVLSNAFVAYARDLRQAPDVGIIYVDPELRPEPPSPRSLLEGASRSGSLPRHIAAIGWMHPYYAQLREALVRGDSRDRSEQELLQVNLERARSLPAASGRHVVVNIAQQRLFMMQDGEVVDSMRVVVGKPNQPTPMMSALIRFTSLNPYWNVPPDLAAERVAPYVVKGGVGYLRKQGYQLLSDWSDKPKLVSAATIDWKAVAEGRKEVRLRQLPGPSNSMGAMKFMFPNAQGIYLHDTPSTELFSEASRMFSGGCVRLEAASRLASWMHGTPLRAKGAKPEQRVDLPQPMPVYLTYLTAVPSGSQVAFYHDIYGRDARRLAELRGGDRLAGR